jgi:hypothetical protein
VKEENESSKYTETRKSLQARSVLLQQSSTRLSQCVTEFEKYLSNLPGRVPASIAFPNFEGKYLVLARDGKAWSLFVGEKDHTKTTPKDKMKLVRESSVLVKMEAVKLFPELLAAVADAQQSLIAQLRETEAGVDAFLRSLSAIPNAGKEGEVT